MHVTGFQLTLKTSCLLSRAVRRYDNEYRWSRNDIVVRFGPENSLSVSPSMNEDFGADILLKWYERPPR